MSLIHEAVGLQKVIITLITVALIACASETVTGRAPIDPMQVAIYSHAQAPDKYEVLGLLEVRTGRDSNKEKVDLELKTLAANLGANGVLLTRNTSTVEKKPNPIGLGWVYSFTVQISLITGKAIHVSK